MYSNYFVAKHKDKSYENMCTLYVYVFPYKCVCVCWHAFYEEKYISIFMFVDLESELGVYLRVRHGVSLVLSDGFHKSNYSYMWMSYVYLQCTSVYVTDMFLILCLLDFTVRTFELMTFCLEMCHSLLKPKIFMKFSIPLLRSTKMKGSVSIWGRQRESRRRCCRKISCLSPWA